MIAGSWCPWLRRCAVAAAMRGPACACGDRGAGAGSRGVESSTVGTQASSPWLTLAGGRPDGRAATWPRRRCEVVHRLVLLLVPLELVLLMEQRRVTDASACRRGRHPRFSSEGGARGAVQMRKQGALELGHARAGLGGTGWKPPAQNLAPTCGSLMLAQMCTSDVSLTSTLCTPILRSRAPVGFRCAFEAGPCNKLLHDACDRVCVRNCTPETMNATRDG